MAAQNEDRSNQENEWGALFDRIRSEMSRFGAEDFLGRGDFLIVDDNYGARIQTVEIHKLKMLDRTIIKALQELLRDFPKWEIVVVIDIPGTEGHWPAMGLTIGHRAIQDDLQRAYLPAEFRSLAYE